MLLARGRRQLPAGLQPGWGWEDDNLCKTPCLLFWLLIKCSRLQQKWWARCLLVEAARLWRWDWAGQKVWLKINTRPFKSNCLWGNMACALVWTKRDKKRKQEIQIKGKSFIKSLNGADQKNKNNPPKQINKHPLPTKTKPNEKPQIPWQSLFGLW